MKKLDMVLLLGFVLVVLAGCAQQDVYNDTGEQPKTQPESGRVVFTITDAAADMGTISSVKVTVESVKVHSVSEGWVEVSAVPKTYDLLQLNAEGRQELLADVQLDEGTYTQIRLNVSKVVVTDNEGDSEAKLPSGDIKIIRNLDIKENSTSTATFDFLANESLHVTGNGEYIMAPVIKLETREDAEVKVKSDNSAEVSGGRIKTNIKVGMDIKGNVGIGIKIPKDTKVSIDAKGILKLG